MQLAINILKNSSKEGVQYLSGSGIAYIYPPVYRTIMEKNAAAIAALFTRVEAMYSASIGKALSWVNFSRMVADGE